jgi:hypothetical protein
MLLLAGVDLNLRDKVSLLPLKLSWLPFARAWLPMPLPCSLSEYSRPPILLKSYLPQGAFLPSHQLRLSPLRSLGLGSNLAWPGTELWLFPVLQPPSECEFRGSSDGGL